MGERAKVIVNKYTALELLKRKDLDLDKFYSSDLKIFINVLREELDRCIKANERAIKLLKEAGSYDEETKTFCDDVYQELPNILKALIGGDKE